MFVAGDTRGRAGQARRLRRSGSARRPPDQIDSFPPDALAAGMRETQSWSGFAWTAPAEVPLDFVRVAIAHRRIAFEAAHDDGSRSSCMFWNTRSRRCWTFVHALHHQLPLPRAARRAYPRLPFRRASDRRRRCRRGDNDAPLDLPLQGDVAGGVPRNSPGRVRPAAVASSDFASPKSDTVEMDRPGRSGCSRFEIPVHDAGVVRRGEP